MLISHHLGVEDVGCHGKTVGRATCGFGIGGGHFVNHSNRIWANDIIWADDIICIHCLKNYAINRKIFEEKLFLLTIWTMFLEISFQVCCQVQQKILPNLSRWHHLYTFSQKLRQGWENIWRKVVLINHLNNVSSNFFQNMLSGLADDRLEQTMTIIVENRVCLENVFVFVAFCG
jgi:hypothetical protein